MERRDLEVPTMNVSRRLVLFGFILVGSQLASGCYCYRPLVFPRLQSCATGGCGPVFPRLAGAIAPPVYGGPAVSGPVYDAPIGYGGVSYGGPISSGMTMGEPGCASCSQGIPLASAPFSGGPIAGTSYMVPPNMVAPGGSAPVPNGAVPMVMPGASTGGVPFDSSLVTPTVKPPIVNTKKLDTRENKGVLTAGK